jgi:hypothetical protein
MSSRPCVHDTLAAGPIGRVELCRGCGCVSLHVGPTTLRLEPQAFQQLVDTLRSASAALEQVSAPQFLPTAPGGHA